MPDSVFDSYGSTSTDLVSRLQANEEKAWSDFVDLYGPLIYSWLRKGGLPLHDAQDQLQNVLKRVTQNIESFKHIDPSHTFRGWLFTITKRLLIDRSRKIGEQAAGGTAAFEWIEQIPDPARFESTLSLVAGGDGVAHRALGIAASEFNEDAIAAFKLTTIDGLTAAEAGEKVGMTPAAVRKAKSRILHRLRELLGETQ